MRVSSAADWGAPCVGASKSFPGRLPLMRDPLLAAMPTVPTVISIILYDSFDEQGQKEKEAEEEKKGKTTVGTVGKARPPVPRHRV